VTGARRRDQATGTLPANSRQTITAVARLLDDSASLLPFGYSQDDEELGELDRQGHGCGCVLGLTVSQANRPLNH
jgi:hypothetical protein